jgi:hypothetical protein
MNFAIALELFVTLHGTALADSPVAGESTTPTDNVSVVVDLSNGIVFRGVIPAAVAEAWVPGQPLLLTLENGAVRNLSGHEIENLFFQSSSVHTEDTPAQDSRMIGPVPMNKQSPNGYSFGNIGKSRYLYAPSAIGLKQGEGYFSQKLLFSAVAVGATDNVTLLAGTFTLFPPLLTIVGGKVSGEVAPNVHLAAGGEVFMVGISGLEVVATVGFGGVTLGHEDSQITLSSGYMSVFEAPAVPLIIAGQHRIGERSVLVTENWFVMGDDNSFAIVTAAYRLLGGPLRTRTAGSKKWTSEGEPRYSIDFGLVTLPYGLGTDFLGPMPWVDFAWHFNLRQ